MCSYMYIIYIHTVDVVSKMFSYVCNILIRFPNMTFPAISVNGLKPLARSKLTGIIDRHPVLMYQLFESNRLRSLESLSHRNPNKTYWKKPRNSR